MTEGKTIFLLFILLFYFFRGAWNNSMPEPTNHDPLILRHIYATRGGGAQRAAKELAKVC